ncbi:hypothetical protein [Allobranchiibius sp. GilTou38]|uniref:hypothetical protein n=1 Tax=Allobranchiibius sp. GilTou38 TaxID=2815210 RepID=UPI001AA1921F|nr:hypothetical protein [Allobranchiibius sp. GilTou38]MBO1765841.1 hypothetical protein [Allobranchiibius sp. GilTou38]
MTVPVTPVTAAAPAAFGKSAICWVQVDGRDWPVWYAPLGDVAYVVSGPGEQELPALPASVSITLRAKDTREYAGRFTASATRLHPGDEEWDEAVGALRPARLNPPDADPAARWSRDGAVWALRPDFDAPAPVAPDAPSGAREPAPTTATTRGRMPGHLGKRRRREG